MDNSIQQNQIKLFLFGNPSMTLEDGTRLDFQIDNPMLLLSYVALNSNKYLRRDDLAILFYPDAPENKANQNIRQIVHRLRNNIKEDDRKEPILLIDQNTIRLNPDANVLIDVLEVDKAVHDAQESFRYHEHRKLESCPVCEQKTRHVVDLIRGELFEGSFPHTGGVLDDWILQQKDFYKNTYLRFLHSLVDYQLQKRDYRGTEHSLESILRYDPMDEVAIRKIMLVLSITGNANLALNRYHVFQNFLQQTLQSGVEEETMMLAYDIRSKAQYTLPNQNSSDGVTFFPNLGEQFDSSIPFYGRETETKNIQTFLEDNHNRIISLRGVIGSGKTRLAVHTAHLVAPFWKDGVKVVLLEPTQNHVTLLTTHLIEAFGIHSPNFVEHRAKLIDHLKNKEVLIVIDNVELSGEYQSLIPALTLACPNIKFLITCRKHLNLRGEKMVNIEGLTSLAEASRKDLSISQIISASPALQMLEFVAIRANESFVIDRSNIQNCIEACELLSGLPSGIELAGSYARLFNPEEIRDAVIGYLSGKAGVFNFILGRHQDFKKKYQQVWKSLTNHERDLVRLVSKHPEGVVTDDLLAENITTIETLVTLQDNSTFIRLTGSRVKLHPVVHFFL